MIAAEYMTAAEIATATQRIRELEEKHLLPPDTIRELKSWWREKLHTKRDPQHPNVILSPFVRGTWYGN